MALQQTINQLANDFANGVLAAIRGASVEEILGRSSKPVSGDRGSRRAAPASRARRAGAVPRSADRRPRRSAEDLEQTIAEIAAALKKNKSGLGAEELRATLGKTKEEIQRPLFVAIKNGQFRKEGEKRKTRYFVA